jgi:hypothetical protein
MVTLPAVALMPATVSVVLVAAERPVTLMSATAMLVRSEALLDGGVAGLASIVLGPAVAVRAVVVMLGGVGMGRRGHVAGRLRRFTTGF